ncbi:hypothetical protein BGX26_003980 [Mortierella sp. AD094]|nr:hypothetical protein BGX26_003980 [Mortierella sp. AD094]
MTGPTSMDLDAKMARTPMESVHPLASAGTPIASSTAGKKPVKGTPISVPTNGRRLSTFSVKSANRALMTGYRDGGSGNARRKSSASSQGHQSPPFFPHKDDFDVIGTVPGFEKLVEAEAHKHNKGRLKAIEPTTVPDDIEHKDHKPTKRKKIDTESSGSDATVVKPAKGRRRSSASVGPLSGGEDSVSIIPSSPPSPPISIPPTLAVSQPPTTAGASFNRLKHINGFSKSIKAAPTSWQQMPLPCVRIWPKAEFTAAGMTVQFGTDRFSLTIRKNSTKIPHAELKHVNFYTGSARKIFQFATFSKLAESSVLAKHYDPTVDPEKAPMITLFIDTNSSSILNICHSLKQKGVDTKRLTSEAAKEIISSNVRRLSTSRTPEKPEETLFVYPFNSSVKSKSIAVRAEDAVRLEHGEFLNDTLIEFGLKKGLANSYEAIKSWTAKVDLFSMKYIIVPIHENLHWYLAIITNPGLLLRKSESSSSTSSSSEPESAILADTLESASGDDSMVPSSEKMVIDSDLPRESKASSINVEEKTDDKSLWSLNELTTKRAKYKDIVVSLTEQYRVYQFHRDLVDDIKGKSNDKCAPVPQGSAPTEVVKRDALDAPTIEAPNEQTSEQTTDGLRIMDPQS